MTTHALSALDVIHNIERWGLTLRIFGMIGGGREMELVNVSWDPSAGGKVMDAW
jgi:hypothetical protein